MLLHCVTVVVTLGLWILTVISTSHLSNFCCALWTASPISLLQRTHRSYPVLRSTTSKTGSSLPQDRREGLPFVMRNISCNDIVFVKTMKCASSSFSLILHQRHSRCHQSGNPTKFTEGEADLTTVEAKANVQSRYREHYFRIAIAREPLSRVISHFYQCRPSKVRAGGANSECRSLAKQGPSAFFGSSSEMSSNLQSRFLGFHQKYGITDPVVAANLYDFIVVKDRLRESLAMLHFYGVLTVRDMYFSSAKNRSIEYVKMSNAVLNTAKSNNKDDFRLFNAIMARHNATLALFSGVDLAAQRWEDRWKAAVERCQHKRNIAAQTWSHEKKAKKKKRQTELLAKCFDEECSEWEPCKQNNLAFGLPGVGMIQDLRNSTFLRVK